MSAVRVDGRARRRPERGRVAEGEIPPDRSRVLLSVALKPSGCALVAVAAVVIVTLVASSSDLTGIYGAIGAGWLAVHQVPVTIGHTTLGILPLAITAAVLWVAAQQCSRAGRIIGHTGIECVRIVAAAVGAPIAVTLLALAVVDDASGVIPLRPPHPLGALGWVVALHAAAALAGLAHSRGFALFDTLPERAETVAAAIIPAYTALRRMLGAAALVTVMALLWHAGRMGAAMDTCDGVGGKIALAALSLAYLPNLVAGAAAFLFGATVHVGAATVGMTGVVAAQLPAVPALAGVPRSHAQPWWFALLLAPLYVAVVLGRECAMRSRGRGQAVASTAVAATLVAVAMLVLLVVSGGELGAFGHVGVGLPPLFALLVFGWLAVPGGIAAALSGSGAMLGVRARVPVAPPPEPAPAPPEQARPAADDLVHTLPGVRFRDRPPEDGDDGDDRDGEYGASRPADDD
jgi:hypothetical protein